MLALVAWFVFVTWIDAPLSQPSVPPIVAPRAVTEARATTRPEAVVISVRGAAEYGKEGALRPLAVGDRLRADDLVRTGREGRVELQIGEDESRLTVPDFSTVQVGELSRSMHGFRLAKGRLGVSYGPSEGRVIRIEGPDGASVAESRGAKFTMLSNGSVVGIATEAGSVNLWAAGKSVEVGPGQQATVTAGQVPTAPMPIPLDVLLKVGRSAQRLDLCAAIKGQVRPGSEVLVDDQPVAVEGDGRFEAQVRQRAGLSQVAVVARELGGATKSALIACRTAPATPRPDETEVEVHWGE